jgi:hypothetical protein
MSQLLTQKLALRAGPTNECSLAYLATFRLGLLGNGGAYARCREA